MVEMVRVRRALYNAVDALGADRISSKLASPVDDREAIAATLDFAIDGLRFEVRMSLLRARH